MKKETNEAPNDALLTLWMDGELDGDELAQVETWVRDHPELLAQRDALQAMGDQIRTNIAASVEPPYPDFFNQRIMRRIDEDLAEASANKEPGQNSSAWHQFGGKWGRWLAFPAAAAAMLLCFHMGTRVGKEPGQVITAAAANASSKIYTPDGDVSADMFSSKDAGATIIVLEGLEDIPDDFEIAGEPNRGRSDHYGAMMVSAEMVF